MHQGAVRHRTEAPTIAMQNFAVSWVDLAILILLLVGMLRGRKRGMSAELLDIFKWAAIAVVAGLAYEPFGQMLSQTNVFSLLFSYVFAYVLLALVILLLFAYVRRRAGQKLMSSDVFGRGEYYLGMIAGAFRYACIIVVAMAFVNARYYSPAELLAQQRAQLEVLGSDFFPSWGEFQQEVFTKSCVGRFTKENLPVLLIKSTPAENKGLGQGNTIRSRRENAVNEAMSGR